jgi:hypothetical protein
LTWTALEDRAVLEWTGPDKELAELLDRPIRAIYNRRFKLRAGARKLGLAKHEITDGNLDRVRGEVGDGSRPERVPRQRRCSECGTACQGEHTCRACQGTHWFVKFCPDCDQGYLAVVAQTQRCPICAAERIRQLAAQRQLRNVGRWPRRPRTSAKPEQLEQRRSRRRAWRAANIERVREQERIRSALRRQRSPEAVHAEVQRYKERKRAGYDPTVEIERKLMEQATRQAVAEIKKRQKQAEWQAERVTPRRCAFCGEIFTPPRVTVKRQIYCDARCNGRAAEQRKKLAKRINV